MDAGDLMAGIAARINPIPGLTGGAHYPPLNAVRTSPVAMVHQSLLGPSRVEQARLAQDVWLWSVDVVLLVASVPERPEDQTRLDPLIPAVLDALRGQAATTIVDGSHIDRLWHDVQVRRQAMRWGATEYCHAAIITLDTKFRR